MESMRILQNIILATILSIQFVSAEDEFITAFGQVITIPENCTQILSDEETYFTADKFECENILKMYPVEAVNEFMDSLHEKGFPKQTVKPKAQYFGSCGDTREGNCCAISKTEKPYLVKMDSSFKLVLQSQYFEQTIETVRCDREQHECFEDFNLEQWMWKTKCKTNWGTTYLYVYNTQTKLVERVSYNFPVACSCAILRV